MRERCVRSGLAAGLVIWVLLVFVTTNGIAVGTRSSPWILSNPLYRGRLSQGCFYILVFAKDNATDEIHLQVQYWRTWNLPYGTWPLLGRHVFLEMQPYGKAPHGSISFVVYAPYRFVDIDVSCGI